MINMVKKSLKRIQSQKGDTIIEVVIAMAVLGLVLGASAVLVSRSSKNMQNSQESAVALREAQRQVELLQFFAGSQPESLPNADEVFCMASEAGDGSDSIKVIKGADGTQCNYLNGGAEYVTHMKLIRHPDEQNGDYYDVYIDVSWETLTGVPGNLELSQRIYKKSGARVGDGGGSACESGWSKSVDGTTCIENKVSVKANVKRIVPSSTDVSVPTCANSATSNRSGTAVRLTGPQVNENKATGSDSSALFSGLIPRQSYTATPTAPAGYTLCSPTSQSTGVIGAGVTKNLDFKIVPYCSVSSSKSYGPWGNNEYGPNVPVYRTDPVYGYVKGIRAGQPGYPGGWTDGWLPWNGAAFTTSLPNGYTYYGEWNGAKRTVGGSGEFYYNFWLWTLTVVGYQTVHVGWAQGPLVAQSRTVTNITTRSCTDYGVKSVSTPGGTERRTSGW